MTMHEHVRPRAGRLGTVIAVAMLSCTSAAAAAAPAATPMTPDLVAAATKYGKETQERETQTIKRKYPEYFSI